MCQIELNDIEVRAMRTEQKDKQIEENLKERWD